MANSAHYRVFCGGGIGNNKVTDEWNNGGGVEPTATGNRLSCNAIYKIKSKKIANNFKKWNYWLFTFFICYHIINKE